MGCTLSNSTSPALIPQQTTSSATADVILSISCEHGEQVLQKQNMVKDTAAPDSIDALETQLRYLSVNGGADTAATRGNETPEDDSSSSSSDSTESLPIEFSPADAARAGPSQTQAPTAPVPGDAAVGLLYDPSMELHLGPDHYERPARIIQLHATLEEQQLMGRCWRLVARQATDAELLLAHSEEHIRKVDSLFTQLYPSRPDSLADAAYCYADGRMQDVYLSEGTAAAARCAAGCCVQAVQSVLSGTVSRALAVVRPPGHHAECERAQGFCFFNNVAVAALEALRQPGVRRVAVLDWDVHHGNGIQDVLLRRPDALYLSLHRDPKRFYPYHSGYLGEAGEGPGTGFNVNVPWLKKGMADGDYMAAFRLVVEPILSAYQPDLVIVAAGFDAADGDPLGGCKLSPEGYAWMTERLMRFAGGRLVLALEGGYNTRVTSWCAAACLRTLLEGRAVPQLPADKEHLWPAESHNSLKLVYEFQRQYWPVLRGRSWTEAWEGHLKEVVGMLGDNVRSRRNSGCNTTSTIITTTTTTTSNSCNNTPADKSSSSGSNAVTSNGRPRGRAASAAAAAAAVAAAASSSNPACSSSSAVTGATVATSTTTTAAAAGLATPPAAALGAAGGATPAGCVGNTPPVGSAHDDGGGGGGGGGDASGSGLSPSAALLSEVQWREGRGECAVGQNTHATSSSSSPTLQEAFRARRTARESAAAAGAAAGAAATGRAAGSGNVEERRRSRRLSAAAEGALVPPGQEVPAPAVVQV
ncbi:hypothetical protein Agub_g6402 [Astrephomene gubernaculifera]|uniref:histone deacetylase n=1 Tax=Astrephomene gubernaculifera TaxID=47775 RepID=A0AAD3HLS7_9CHLO|nr:hypothetical protein Agub_g6402 [Astrephomene gubernaculifera]